MTSPTTSEMKKSLKKADNKKLSEAVETSIEARLGKQPSDNEE